jgi:hypothetical protein
MINLKGSGITTVWIPNKRNSFIRIKESSKIDGVIVTFQNDRFQTKTMELNFNQLVNLLCDTDIKKFLGV